MCGGREDHDCKNLPHTSKTWQVKRPKWLQLLESRFAFQTTKNRTQHRFVTKVLWSRLHLSYSGELAMRLAYQILLKSSPLTLLAGSALGRALWLHLARWVCLLFKLIKISYFLSMGAVQTCASTQYQSYFRMTLIETLTKLLYCSSSEEATMCLL